MTSPLEDRIFELLNAILDGQARAFAKQNETDTKLERIDISVAGLEKHVNTQNGRIGKIEERVRRIEQNQGLDHKDIEYINSDKQRRSALYNAMAVGLVITTYATGLGIIVFVIQMLFKKLVGT